VSDARPRLVVVSAHFPPDFVSGGTLVPDRQARGLAERGWDVSVYAGSLSSSHKALDTWTEDVDGLPVRWIGIAPFIGWSDPKNFENDEVVEAFEEHLAMVRPDVVHLHSLQTMGGGMVRIAKESGAKVVVTMHDFWWFCARQFLVDRAWVPCSLVVEAGVCHCEVDRTWADIRNDMLRRELVHADLVLAPSQIAAEVLAGNGIPWAKLRAEENGLDEVPAATDRPGRAPGAPLRFRYAGGDNRMKGSAVIAEAARRLAVHHPSGWTLSIHAEEAPFRTEVGDVVLPGAARVVPPFDPARLDEVLADTDVLVIPSIMRETHSLLTREALLRGVPVITSDSLGPEEVVEHGRNGLLVPTGDAEALAAAMAAAVDHPDQVQAWSEQAVHVTIRRSGDQLDAIDATLRALLDPPAPDPATLRSPLAGIDQVLFVVGIDGAPLRYRAHLPAEALELRGITAHVRHYRDPEVPRLAERADAVVFYRVPATVQVLEQIERLRQGRPHVPILFDVDDLIFDPDLAAEIPAIKVLPKDEADLWMQGVRRYRTTMEACDAYIGSTEQLCRHAEAVVGIPAHRFANGVGTIVARRSDLAVRRERAPGPLRIGYLSGTTTHDRDWAEIEAVVLDVLDEVGGELWLGGHLTPSPAVDRLGARLRRLPMQDWRHLPGVLRDLDVNLAPLEPLGRFNEGKSAIKWLEAALCGTPTIASPTQPFAEAIRHGENGFLATTPAEWGSALRTLLTDDVTRNAVGARARRDALLGWSPHLQADRYLEILLDAQAMVAHGRTPRQSNFEPVALDEPLEPSPLQPYADDESLQMAALPPTPLKERITRAARVRGRQIRRSAKEAGVGPTVAKVARGTASDGRRAVGAVVRRFVRRP
jgi:glycosyltransferase involved in cell wall biosynthesis